MNEEEIELKPVQLLTLSVVVEGPRLLMNKYGDDVQKEMEDKYQKGEVKAKTKKQDILQLVEGKIHRFPDGTVCFPAAGFKKGMGDAAIELDGMTKKQVERGVRFTTEYVPISFKEQLVYSHWAKKSGRNQAPYMCYRPEFREWSATLLIQYDVSVITPQAILTLLNQAGFYSGVGDWRPGKGGDVFGFYQVRREDGEE